MLSPLHRMPAHHRTTVVNLLLVLGLVLLALSATSVATEWDGADANSSFATVPADGSLTER